MDRSPLSNLGAIAQHIKAVATFVVISIRQALGAGEFKIDGRTFPCRSGRRRVDGGFGYGCVVVEIDMALCGKTLDHEPDTGGDLFFGSTDANAVDFVFVAFLLLQPHKYDN